MENETQVETVKDDKNKQQDQKFLLIIGWILGWIGVLVVFLAGDKSNPDVRFWLNQMLVYDLFGLLVCIPFVGLVWGIVMLILWIIGLVNICQGKTEGVPLIGKIKIYK